MFNMVLKLSHYLCVWRKSWIFVGFIKLATSPKALELKPRFK